MPLDCYDKARVRPAISGLRSCRITADCPVQNDTGRSVRKITVAALCSASGCNIYRGTLLLKTMLPYLPAVDAQTCCATVRLTAFVDYLY